MANWDWQWCWWMVRNLKFMACSGLDLSIINGKGYSSSPATTGYNSPMDGLVFDCSDSECGRTPEVPEWWGKLSLHALTTHCVSFLSSLAKPHQRATCTDLKISKTKCVTQVLTCLLSSLPFAPCVPVLLHLIMGQTYCAVKGGELAVHAVRDGEFA